MAKHVCLEGGLMHASGNVNAVCEDGSKKVIRLRMTPTGRQVMGFGLPKRNLDKHPYSQDEKDARKKFTVVSKAVKARKADTAAVTRDRAEFAKQNDYVTFHGFLFAKASRLYNADTQIVVWGD